MGQTASITAIVDYACYSHPSWLIMLASKHRSRAVSDLFNENGQPETPQQKGGKARAERLTPEQRADIARTAAQSRWGGDGPVLKATHGSSDRPLVIGDLSLPCYVLEDGRRVLSLGGMVRALGMSIGGGGKGEGDRLGRFLGSKSISPFVSNDLISRIRNPIRFQAPTGGSVATGYEATILPDICDAILASRKNSKLHPQQAHIADQAEILVRGLARVGIIALVDEATGYQEVRDRKALEEILNKFLSEHLRPWTKTFPDEYFTEMFRLKKWRIPGLPTARPGVMAQYTRDIVYARIAPGVLGELEVRNPTDGHGRRRHKHHQHLSGDHGHPKLKDHLDDVVILMRAAETWPEFRRLLERVKPRISAPGELPFDPGDDEDNA